MEQALQVFSYNDKQVRTTEINGEIWFVARDVCDVLEIVDYHQAVEVLDEDEKGIGYSIPTPGGKQNMTVICESGVYALVFKSRKPEAKAFTRWVTHDVLPSIRKIGSYSVDSKPTITFDPMQSAKLIFEIAGIKDNQLALALDKVHKSYTGRSALEAGEISLIAPTKRQLLTPTEIGTHTDGASGERNTSWSRLSAQNQW